MFQFWFLQYESFSARVSHTNTASRISHERRYLNLRLYTGKACITVPTVFCILFDKPQVFYNDVFKDDGLDKLSRNYKTFLRFSIFSFRHKQTWTLLVNLENFNIIL